MKTVLIVNGAMGRGGAEVMIMDLLRKLHTSFNFVFLINRKKGTNPVGDFDEEIKSFGIPIYYIDAVWDVGIFEYERQFKKIVEAIGKIDIVHSHLNSKGGIISRCAYRCNIPRRIVHCHAKLIFNGSILSRFANNVELYIQRYWINKYATDYWACSEEAMTSLYTKEHINSDRGQVIHNAINVSKFTSVRGETLADELGIVDEPVIGSVGRIANVKNYKLTAKIIKELWNRGHNFHYVVAGRKQDDEQVKFLFDTLGRDKRFHYLGVRDDVERIYNGIDIYLGTSLREGLGLSAVEAQASGDNCFLSGGFPKLCDVGLNRVKFIESKDVIIWADEIEKALTIKRETDVGKIVNAIRTAGFDVELEAKRVKELYNSYAAVAP